MDLSCYIKCMKKWLIVIILAAAQFVMVLDSTVMNVSISTVAADLNTSITGMQAAITFYTLTMAALMLTGAKLGDIWGRLPAFRIGAVIYGVGSLITGLAGSLGVLMFGWSIVEGLGAVLVIPAIASLAATNYKGKDRLVAFSAIGVASGLAAAAGPLIGGYMTEYLSWRYVFFAETVVMALVLLASGRIKDTKVTNKPKLDVKGAVLSATGMGLLVFGILQSKTWGWITPLAKPEIAGYEVAPLGISLVAYLIAAGAMLLYYFFKVEADIQQKGGTPLLKVSLLKIPLLKSGLRVLSSQYFITAAVFFTIPVYLQTILGYDALETGKKIIPLSVGLIICSVAGSKMVANYSPRKIVRLGQLFLVAGSLVLVATVAPTLNGFWFTLGMFTLGAGLGLLASQIGNINMSAVGKEDTAEAGGLQGTFQNLGSSIGTALVGSIFIGSLLTGFTTSINQSQLSPAVKSQIAAATETGIGIVSPEQAEQLALDNGATPAEASEISQLYEDSQVQGLKHALFFISVIGLLSVFLSKDLPKRDPDTVD